jgi:hypothetical protein
MTKKEFLFLNKLQDNFLSIVLCNYKKYKNTHFIFEYKRYYLSHVQFYPVMFYLILFYIVYKVLTVLEIKRTLNIWCDDQGCCYLIRGATEPPQFLEFKPIFYIILTLNPFKFMPCTPSQSLSVKTTIAPSIYHLLNLRKLIHCNPVAS